MNRTSVSFPVILDGFFALALAGCGGGGAATAPPAPAATSAPTAATAAPPAGGLTTADQLCAVMTGLAATALGGPMDEPGFGDVVPRPNGIYCHFQLTGDAGTNVEAQLKNMTREEFESLAETLGATTELSGVGEAAFGRDGSSMGGPGATVVAWSNGQGVTILLNREGDQAEMTEAARAIAAAVLAGL
jgi:hypothetical protein